MDNLNKIVEPKKQTDITYEYYSTAEYIEHYSVPNNIKETTITGSGTVNDPWIINSTSDFVFVFAVCQTAGHKHIELNTDIIFNEETFDENGQPHGGDGKVYNWQPKTETYHNGYVNLDGKGHALSGFYKNERGENAYLIYTATTIKNCTIRNEFFKVTSSTLSFASGLAHEAENLYNCKIYDSYIIGRHTISGFSKTITGEVKNCENYATILGRNPDGNTVGSSRGIVGIAKRAEGCVNYGYVEGGNACGITGYASALKDCINYGKIYSSGESSGLCLGLWQAKGKGYVIDNCVNYGNVIAPVSAGIVSQSFSNNNIINCKNFGLIEGETAGECIAQAAVNGEISQVNVINFQSNSASGKPVVNKMVAYNGGGIDLKISKSVLNYGKVKNKIINCFSEASIAKSTLSFEDSLIVGGKSNTVRLLGAAINSTKISIKNIKMELDVTAYSNFISTKNYDTKNVSLDGVIIENNNDASKQAFGENFSGFYCSWKTGEIGIIALDGKGLFQEILSKNKMIDLGYMQSDDEANFVVLDYIESNGTQYIDTEYIPNSNTSCYFDFEYLGDCTGGTEWAFLAGARTSLSENNFSFPIKRVDGFVRFEYSYQNNFAVTTKATDRTIIETNKNIFIYKGVEQELKEAQFKCKNNFYLFEINDNGKPTSRGPLLRLYECKIYDNGSLVRSFVPVRRISDEQIGLYDKENKKFYGNSGTGIFIAGEKKQA